MSTDNARYTQIKTAMLLHMPFFASLLLDMMDVQIGKYPEKFGPMKNTAATDGKTIYFDEDWLGTLDVPGGVFVTCHEIGHAMFHHMARARYYVDLGLDGEPFDPRLFNVAADYVINDMLVKSGLTMPTGPNPKTGAIEPIGLLDPKYTSDMSVEEVYRMLKKQQKQQGKGKGKGKGGKGNPGDQPGEGEGDGEGDGEGQFDKHIHETSTISPAEMKRAIQSAVDTAKACGKLPGNLKRFAEQLIEPQVDWKERLRYLVVTKAARDTSTWTRPHRRRLTSQGIYLARPSGFGCKDIVVAIDTSGSIGQKELTVFLSELADILRSCAPERVFVLGVDSAVASVEELAGDTDISQNPPHVGGGGGTDFRPAFEWVSKNGITPDVFVYLTDLYGPAPEQAPDYPVIWGCTNEQIAPFGETVAIKA